MEMIMSICLGLGLAAGTGFRVFIPVLAANIASLAGWYHFAPGFDWLGGWPAFAMLATATAVEIVAYYIPWLDNFFDHIGLPIAVAAGTLLTASFLTGDWHPALRWAMGLLAGGSTAGIIHSGLGLLRLGSSASTGGAANPILATVENGLSATTAILALLIPVAVAIAAVLLVVFVANKLRSNNRQR
jgi:hypothetical protein